MQVKEDRLIAEKYYQVIENDLFEDLVAFYDKNKLQSPEQLYKALVAYSDQKQQANNKLPIDYIRHRLIFAMLELARDNNDQNYSKNIQLAAEINNFTQPVTLSS